MVPPIQSPPQQVNPQPMVNSKFSQKRDDFNTVEQIEEKKDEFNQLNENMQKNIIRNLVKRKLSEMPDLVNPSDLETTETVQTWLVDKDLFELDELLINLKDTPTFRELVQEAINLAAEEDKKGEKWP